MRSRRIRFFAFPVLLAALGTLACAGTGINRGDFNLMSLEQEWELGDQLAADIARQTTLLETPAVQRYITSMGQKILAAARDEETVAKRPWHFHVVDGSEINAFNIPGGHVYVYSGLIARARNYSELMGVIAHEASHGLARHAAENLSKRYGLSVLAGLVLGRNPAVYQEILASILAGGAVMKFSRDAEREADRLGIRYMHQAGVDPRGMVDFFRVLLELRERQPGRIERFFASHPMTEERIANGEREIARLPARTVRRDDPGFAAFKNAVASASRLAR